VLQPPVLPLVALAPVLLPVAPAPALAPDPLPPVELVEPLETRPVDPPLCVESPVLALLTPEVLAPVASLLPLFDPSPAVELPLVPVDGLTPLLPWYGGSIGGAEHAERAKKSAVPIAVLMGTTDD
jgi:hypothetical protein